MKQYLDAVRTVLAEGTRKQSRTGVDTLSTFGLNMRFDLRDGRFPLLTTKRINWEHIVGELLHFMSGRADDAFLRKMGCGFWRPWTTEEGLLDGQYAERWRSFPVPPEIVTVPSRRVPPQTPPGPVRHFPARDPAHSPEAHVGHVFPTRHYSKIRVLTALCAKRYTVQFVKTGYVTEAHIANMRSGNVKDPFHPRVCGVGFLGHGSRKALHGERLYAVWADMLQRCYRKQASGYAAYGGAGIFVDARWHNFGHFQEDAPGLAGWRRWVEEAEAVHLDKDYYSSNCYSRETCIWLPRAENVMYVSTATPLYATPLSGGATRLFLSASEAAQALGGDHSRVSKCLRGESAHHKGHEFKLAGGGPYRYQSTNDQLAWVVDELKRNPMSRRLVVSAWAPGLAQTSNLPPCHLLFVFNVQNLRPRGVSNAELDALGVPDDFGLEPHLCLHLTQRSADMGLGVPYNIASYALLLSIVAQMTGLKAGIFSHSLVDAHVYTSKPDGSQAEYDHVPALREQLTRKVRPMPRLDIGAGITGLDVLPYLLTMDKAEIMEQFKLHDYNPHPAIKMKVAV